MKKINSTKKTMATLALAGLVLSATPVGVFAADATPTDRIFGSDRIETAVKVAQAGWTTAATVIVAPAADANLVDALAAAPLAGKENAPILLTDGAALDAKTKQAIIDLKASKVYAVGALSEQVVKDLQAIGGISVEALKGADRIETATKIAAKISAPAGTFVVGYNALADALSVASFAAANNYQILVAHTDGSLPASEKAVGTTYVVGGPTLVADVAGATRLAGADRFETNQKVLAALNYNYNKAYVANGEQAHLVDSLVGSSLAAKDKAPIVLSDTVSALAAADIQAKLTTGSQVIALGGSTLVPDAVRNSLVNGLPTGDLSVKNVSAASANSFKAVFSAAPADTTKVSFNVTRATTPVPITVTWNTAKTEATLTGSANFTEGTYSVAIKNVQTDLGTKTVNVSELAVAKINITSTKLAVSGDGKGYATYQVLDQYGNDITTSNLANSLSFQSGIGTVTYKDGLLTVTPSAGVNLIQFGQVIVTAQNSDSGVSTSATLATSTALGTLSEMTLNKLTNVENKVLTAGDGSSIWYADYTAKDLSGNLTKDYTLIKNGLILSTVNGNSDSLTTSSPYVRAQVVQDPNDSNKAALQVTVDPTVTLAADLPVAITAMSYSGTSSTLNVTLKKAATTDSFTLQAPAYDLAVGEQKTVPFTAVDQNGTAVTKYNDLMAAGLTFSPADKVQLNQNVDGTASLLVGPFATDGPQIITALTASGKISTLTLNIQKVALADTLSMDSSVLVNTMQGNAVQKVDFGLNYGGFAVNDQYGRAIDMTGTPGNYEVQASSSNANVINVSGNAAGAEAITISAGAAAGQATVTFKLVDKTNPSVVISSKSATFSVVQNSDIKDYSIDTIANPIYAVTDLNQPVTEKIKEFAANPHVYGTTAGGSKVLLAGSPIQGAYVDNTTEFKVATGLGVYDSVYVVAGTLDASKTAASTTLTVTLLGADGSIHSLTTPLKSSTVAPTAKTISAFVSTSTPGISVNTAGDIITVDLSKAAANFASGKSLAKFDANGSDTNRAGVYLYAIDQYGTEGMSLAQIVKAASGSTLTDAQFNVTSDGTITGTGAVNGDVVLTGVTTNGLIKTIKLHFING